MRPPLEEQILESGKQEFGAGDGSVHRGIFPQVFVTAAITIERRAN
jgi:hypothetical protein